MRVTAYDRVKAARSTKRPTGLDYFHGIFTDFFELHGDRRYGDDGAIVGGVALLKGQPVTVIAIEKGHSTKERMARSFGAPNPEGYRKALRLMRQAEKFHRPVVCFIDTSGAYCGIGAEERGQGEAIARNLSEMGSVSVPIVSCVTGEGGSGGALGLCVADEVLMLGSSSYSVISPEACASILWKDTKKAPEAADALRMCADDLVGLGLVDGIVDDAGRTAREIGCDLLGRALARFDELSALSPDELLARRYGKFRAMGSDRVCSR